MKLRLLACACLLFAPAMLEASHTSVIAATGSGGVLYSPYYSGTTFSNFGAVSSRVEQRVDVTASSSQTEYVGGAPTYLAITGATSVSTGNLPDTLTGTQQYISLTTNGGMAAGAIGMIRLTRDLTLATCPTGYVKGCWWLQVWQLYPSLQYWSVVSPDISSIRSDWTNPGGTWQTTIGSAAASATAEIAFLEWFTGVVPMGQGTGYCNVQSPLQACVPDISDSHHGQLSSYPFNGSLADTSGNGLTLSGTPSSYAATPIEGPLCNAGALQTFATNQTSGSQAGFGLSLNYNSTTVSYAWQQTAGPVGLALSGATTATLGLTGYFSPTNIIGGTSPSVPSYIFGLTVTDYAAAQAYCSIKLGAVTVGANDVVIPLGTAGINVAGITTLLGPQLRSGSANNPWPWLDLQLSTQIANKLAKEYGLGVIPGCTNPNYNACWFYPQYLNFDSNGSLTYSAGAGGWTTTATVTGSDTQFQTDLCGGGTTPTANTVITVEYSGTGGSVLGTTGFGPAKLGYHALVVNGCPSQTTLTVSAAQGSSDAWMPYWGTPTGRYSVDPGGNYQMQFGVGSTNSPYDFYCNSCGLLAGFIKTGIDDDYKAFVTTATQFWTSPQIDQGSFLSGYLSSTMPAVRLSETDSAGQFNEMAPFLLALARGDAQCTNLACSNVTTASAFPTLRNYYDITVDDQLSIDLPCCPQMGDRINAHQLNALGFAATYDPAWRDSRWGLSAQQWLDNLTAPLFTANYLDSFGGLIDGNLYYAAAQGGVSTGNAASSYGTWCTTTCNGTYITLTHGSTAVTGYDGSSGGALAWVSGSYGNGYFLWVLPESFSPAVPASLTLPYGGLAAWSPSNVGAPLNPSSGYSINNVVSWVTDAHHLTLASAWTGASGNYWYELSLNTGIAGFYIQPYMEGSAGDGFERAYSALTALGDTQAAEASTLAQAAATYVATYTQDTSLGGTWGGIAYLTSSNNCYPVQSTFPHDGNCDGGDTAEGARQLAPEASMGPRAGFMLTGSAFYKNWVDAAYYALWAPPGYAGGDGIYLSCLLPGQQCANWAGNFSYGTNYPWKWFGQFFGISISPSWPAVRLGGLPASPTAMVYVPFRLASVSAAAKVVMTRTGTDGVQTVTTCTASPCAIAVARADNVKGVQVQMQFETSGGAVLATSSTPVVIR